MSQSRLMLCRMLEGKSCAVFGDSRAVLLHYDPGTDSFGTDGQIINASDVSLIHLIELLQEADSRSEKIQELVEALLKTSC